MLGNHIKIVYASTSGNVEAVCETVADVLKEHNYEVSMHRSEQTSIDEIVSHPLFIFACSTWEHGEPNPFFDRLIKEIGEMDMNGKHAGLIGLGDFRYEPVHYNVGIDFVRDAFHKKGGQTLGVPLKLNGDPYQYLSTSVTEWAHKIAGILLEMNKD